MRIAETVGETTEAGGRGQRRSFLAFVAFLGSLVVPRSLHAARKTVVATGYCPCADCCGRNSRDAGGHGLTASGHPPHPGVTVAADWAIFPAGTRLFIQSIGHRVVQDRGRDIVGSRIDIFFRSHEEALTFGRRTLSVRVVR